MATPPIPAGATGVQQRLKLKSTPIDTWTLKEQLGLASSVVRSGDQNWVSVSRSMKQFGEPGRPPDWFSQKNCALQYNLLLEKVDIPGRKRGEKLEGVETPGESIVRKLTAERIKELRKEIETRTAEMNTVEEEVNWLGDPNISEEKMDEIEERIKAEEAAEEAKRVEHEKWLKEREGKKQAIQLALKQYTKSPIPNPPKLPSVMRRSSSQSEAGLSEPDSAADSPVQDDDTPATPPPAPTPVSATSPLLTSLLQRTSPAPTAASQSNILDIISSTASPIKSTQPTISSPLAMTGSPTKTTTTTAASSPVKPQPADSAKTQDEKPTTAVTTSAPTSTTTTTATKTESEGSTLSKLLAMPPVTPADPPSIDEAVKEQKTEEVSVKSEPADEKPEGEIEVADTTEKPKEEVVEKQEEEVPVDPKEEEGVRPRRGSTRSSIRSKPSQEDDEDETKKGARSKRTSERSEDGDPDTPTLDNRRLSRLREVDAGGRGRRGSGTTSRSSSPTGSEDRDDSESDSRFARKRNLSKSKKRDSEMDSGPASPTGSESESSDSLGLWKKQILLLWENFLAHKCSNTFQTPPNAKEAPDYNDVVLRPMDLNRLKKNIESGVVNTTAEFHRDTMLIFANAIMYNSSDSQLFERAQDMSKYCSEIIGDFYSNQHPFPTAPKPKAASQQRRSGKVEKSKSKGEESSKKRRKRRDDD